MSNENDPLTKSKMVLVVIVSLTVGIIVMSVISLILDIPL